MAGILSKLTGATGGRGSFSVRIEGVPPLVERFRQFPDKLPRVVELNFRTLGKRLGYLMGLELKAQRYTGETEASISTEIDVGALRMETGPTTKQSVFLRTGTGPHWAPIGPLKRWAFWKLGDENAAYAVQRSIARRGTSAWALRLYGSMANRFPERTLNRGDAQTAIVNTARRLGTDLVATIASDEWVNVSSKVAGRVE